MPRPTFAERLGLSNDAISSLEPKHPALRLALRIGVVLVIVASIAFAVAKEAGRIGDVQWRFEPGWLALCVAALVLFQWIHIELWRLTLRLLGGQIEPRRARAIWSTTLLARYVPTSALMAVGRVALAEREGVFKRVTLASVAYEFAFTVVSSLGLCVYLLWRLPALDAHEWVRWLATAVVVLGIVALHPALFHRGADYAFKRLGRAPLPLSLPFARVVELTVMYTVSFVVAGVAVLAMAQALHGLPASDTYAAIASYGLGYVAGVIAFVIPGSLGAREAGVALGLSAVLPAPVAVAVAIAVRLLQMGVEVLYAVVMPVLARRRSRPGSPRA
ncbi:MAG: glycosyltransferase 2 family protein [Thermoleophilaceae bacterium]|nr:glycosyltransferase 2 family protein [Thermoleophilaceae bacterium]